MSVSTRPTQERPTSDFTWTTRSARLRTIEEGEELLFDYGEDYMWPDWMDEFVVTMERGQA